MSALFASKTVFNMPVEYKKKYGILDDILAWCKTGLTAEWRWQLISVSSNDGPGDYIFYFDSERDYLAFVMKWR